MIALSPDHLAAIVLAACAAAVGYAYFVYPLIVWGASKAFGRSNAPNGGEQLRLPTVSLVIAAHNESACIAARIENALSIDYPKDRFTIVVGSDGSTDDTVLTARMAADERVQVIDFQVNRGKAAVLNSLIEKIDSEIVVFSDANTYNEPLAVRRLVRWFVDPHVGAVCGRLVLRDPATGNNVDSLYWRYETFIKKCEGRLGALLGANGAIYALRRQLYTPIPQDTIIDDFVIPLLAKIRTRCRIVFDAEAVAYEDTPPDMGAEFRRRARIGAGGFQSLGLLWPLLNPRFGWLALAFFSHKVLRWLGPFFLIGGLVANVLLLDKPGYAMLFAAQLGFYGTALLGGATPGGHVAIRILRVPAMFVSMNAALLVGFLRWMTGRQKGTWQRTARPIEPGAIAVDADLPVTTIARD